MKKKVGEVFRSTILGQDLETVEWTSSCGKDNRRCQKCALYYTCKIKEDIEGRRKDVGHCSRASRLDGKVVYFRVVGKEEPERNRQRKPGDKLFSKILGSWLEVKEARISGRCDHCAYHEVCMGVGLSLHKLRNLEAGNCAKRFRDDDTAVYFVKKEKVYDVGEDVYDVLREFESDMDLTPEEIKSYQQALLDTIYVEKNIHGK
jgi:hypothetical protein